MISPKPVILLLLICLSCSLIAQKETTPNWLDKLSASRFTLKNAEITIDDKNATYKDLLKIPDSSLLKVEVYSREYHISGSLMQQKMKASVDITLHKKHFPYYSKKSDTALYVIDNLDSILCNKVEPPNLYEDTSAISWLYFLSTNLRAGVPAKNGAPPGLYNIDMTFLINKNGSVSDIIILEDPGYGTVKEVLRLMKKSPKWTPAKCDGKPVAYRQRERITFLVTEY